MKLKIFLNEMPYDDALNLLSSLDDTFPKDDITPEVITKYRRKLAMKYHPDRNPLKKTETTHIMQQINDALDSLEKNKERSEYSWSHREKPDSAEDFAEYFKRRGKEYYNYKRRQQSTKNYKYQRPMEAGTEPWSWAGYSGGTPSSDNIYNESPRDMNWVKKQGWIIGGKRKKPKEDDEFTYWQFDGNFSRGVMSAFTSGKHYSFIPYFLSWCDGNTKAVVITRSLKEHKLVTIYIIDNGKILNDSEGVHYKLMKHNSFNGNPFNDNFNNTGDKNNFVDNLKLHIEIMMKKYGGK
jgi:hypothetical protein